MITTWLISVAPLTSSFLFGVMAVIALGLTMVDKAFYPKQSFWDLLKPNMVEEIKGAFFSFIVALVSIVISLSLFERLATFN